MKSAIIHPFLVGSGFVFLLLLGVAFSQEPRANPAPYPVATPYQAAANRIPEPPSGPLLEGQTPNQFYPQATGGPMPPAGQYPQAQGPYQQAAGQSPQSQVQNPYAAVQLQSQQGAPEGPRPLSDDANPTPPPMANGSPDLPPGTLLLPAAEPARKKLWEGGVELGLDGSEGNSQAFNLHFGANLKRKTDFNTLSSELDYKKNSANSVETVNKAFLDSRFEHLFQSSPWTWFAHNIEDYDEFKAYDLRVSIDTGIGYQWIKNDRTSLISRVGGGTTREIGGPDDQFIPEAVFGIEGEYKISKKQKLCASVEYRPNVTDFTDYRLYSKAAWEVLLDEEKHLSMKVSILDRYDSFSDGLKPNDLDYALTLLWSF
jgi:putative salt-induced outer membrane protein YdiY